MAYVNTLKNTLETNLNEVAPYRIMSSVIEAVQKKVEEKLNYLEVTINYEDKNKSRRMHWLR